MQQYFINTKTATGETIEFNEEQSHHILHVLRMKKGDIVRISDVDRSLFYVSIDQKGKLATGTVLERIDDTTVGSVEITLVQGLIKGEKWDYLLQKACELGVHRIIPFVSSRSVVKVQQEKLDKKLVRWNKIAMEACEQCKRSTLVEVCAPITFQDIPAYASSLNVIAYEDADIKSEKLSQLLKKHPAAASITCVIGSEGGFSKDEVEQLCAQGFERVSLGSRILRAETAALSIVNNIGFYYDMVGDKDE